MRPALIVGLLSFLFVATHIGLATSRVRTALIARLGPWGFATLFSVVAATSFSVFIHYYAGARFEGAAGLDLARFGLFRYVAIAAITAGVALTTASFWSLPASGLPMLNPHSLVPRGLERVTRHPLFVGVALLGISHMLLASHLVGCVAFGALTVLAVAGAMHQDRKLRSQMGDRYAEYLAHTSIMPFAAIVAGRQRLVARELPWTGFAVGVAIAFALRSVHASILASGGLWVITAVLGGAVLATVQTLIKRRRRPRANQAEPSAADISQIADPARR